MDGGGIWIRILNRGKGGDHIRLSRCVWHASERVSFQIYSIVAVKSPLSMAAAPGRKKMTGRIQLLLRYMLKY